MRVFSWPATARVALSYAFTIYAVPAEAKSQDQSTFENPHARDRPRFRYWLPDASVDPVVLKEDVLAAAELGMGGIEFLPYYNYGGQIGGPPSGVDWVKYGFGTSAFLELLEAALEAHDDNGLVMDFGLGPSEGQGVPADPDEEGLQWDLTIVGWGTGDLVAVVSAVVTRSRNVTKSIIVPPSPQPMNLTHEEFTIKKDTLLDITEHVNLSNGLLNAVLPSHQGNDTVRIFSFYEKRTLKRNLDFASNESSSGISANGSYVVDHFSARGAKITTRFWDKYILSNGRIRDMLKRVGNAGWEDSIELRSNISWSPTLLKRFEKKHGYDLRPYLPLITFGNNNINLQSDAPGPYDASLSSRDLGEGFVNDYRSTLTDGYIEYLQTLSAWLDNSLGLQLSAQPAYNLPMNMISVVSYVGIPESESLQGSNNIDGYRQFAGPSNLAGNNVVSNELGAVFGKAFSLTIPELLHMANRGFAGGLNQYIVHGQPYSGKYPETTWPGHTPFLYYASDLYTRKRPDWKNGLQEGIEYLSRVQHVQRQGIPRTDVAVYVNNVTDPYFGTIYDSEDLNSQGWSYNYLSPENLDLPDAVIEDKVLAPERAAYRTLIVQSSQNLTLSGTRKIESFAKKGFPVVLAGGVPGYYPTADAADNHVVKTAIDTLAGLPSVHVVDKGNVATKLQEIGLQPRVATRTNGTVYTTWREDAATGVDYLYVFSDLFSTTGELVVQSNRIPYSLDPWSGSRIPVQHYHVEKETTVLPVTLAANQTAIFAFAKEPLEDIMAPGDVRINNASSNVIGYRQTKRGLEIYVAQSDTPGKVQLSTDEVIEINSTAAHPFTLDRWNLTAEIWEAPDDLYDASIPAMKHNATQVVLKDLVPWSSLPGLQNASGVGYYTTTFDWNHSHCGRQGAYILLPPALNAIILRVNGEKIPPLDPTQPMADISKHLVLGENEIAAIVPSTMWNYLRTMLYELESSGREPLLNVLGVPPPSENGLVGTVRIIPFERVLV